MISAQPQPLPSTDLELEDIAPAIYSETISGFEAPSQPAASWIFAPEHTLIKRLYERRLSAETIQFFAIQPHANGWQYPAAGGSRWKNANSQAQPKYKWLGAGKPSGAEFYHGDDLMQSVQASSGALWIASGEPDVWSLRSAGINHALSGFTEAAVSQSLREVLYSLGVLIVYIAPDLDPTGKLWSRKIAAALAGSGIELDCRELPASLGAKGDIGKAWQSYEARIPFERWLTGLPRYEPEPLLEPKAERIALTGETLYNVPDDYRLAIIEQLGVLSFGSDGWSSKTKYTGANGKHKSHVICPFHNDTTPSASVHKEIGLKCWSACNGKVYTWREIGEALGIGSIAEWHKTHGESAQPLVNTALTCELREALVKAGRTSSARVIDAMYSLGFEAGQQYEFSHVNKLLADLLSSSTLRLAISEDCKESSFCLFLPTLYSLQQSTIEKTSKNSAKKREGRPSKLFTLPTPAQIAEILGVRIGLHYATMPAEALKDRRLYRAEVYASLPRRKAGSYARKVLTERIGVTARTALEYDRLAGLKVTQQFKRELLTAEDIASLPESLSDIDKIRRRKWLENGEVYTQERFEPEPAKAKKSKRSRIGEPRRFQAIREAAELALSCSPTRQVWLVTQEKNYYEPGTEQASQPLTPLKPERLPVAQIVTLEPASKQAEQTAKTQPSASEQEFEDLCNYYAKNFTPLTPAIEVMLRDWQSLEARDEITRDELKEIGELLAFYRLNFGELDQAVIDLLWSNVKAFDYCVLADALSIAKERRASIKNPKAYIQKIIESEKANSKARVEQWRIECHARRVARSLGWLNVHLRINKRACSSSNPVKKSRLAGNIWRANCASREARYEALFVGARDYSMND